MWQRAMNVTGGGGTCASGDTVKVGGVESTSVSGTSTEFTVETGLSSIKRFVIFGDCSASGFPMQSAEYDDDIVTGVVYTSLYGTGPQGIRYTLPASANAYGVAIKSISGGTVTLSTCTNAAFANMTKIHWFAE